jgi:ribonuclease Z
MNLAGFEIDAVSIGGLETCIQLPGLDLCFDIGRCPPTAIRRRTVLLTHTHVDHAGGIVAHAATRDMMHLPPPTWYVPEENAADLEALVEVWRRLDRAPLPVQIVACRPGDRLELRPGLVATPFRSPHRTICQGYALSRKVRKLRPELVGLTDQEIRTRRLAGEDVSVETEAVEVAFTGDSLIDVVEREAVVRTARLLIMEVTFLDERVPVHKARGSGHIHLDEVIERADLFENDALLFTHFSSRYNRREIADILHRRLPTGLKERVTALLPD